MTLAFEHPHNSTGQDNRKLLMWAFLASDCMFFGTLIATYMVYKNRSPGRVRCRAGRSTCRTRRSARSCSC